MINAWQLQQAATQIELFFFHTGLALRLIEHENLVAAFETLGMSKEAVPSRKTGSYLTK